MEPALARHVSLQTARALACLHSDGLCHGDITASNIALRLSGDFDSLQPDDVLKLFGPPKTSPVHTYSGTNPRPHAPEYVVESLDFCSAPTNLLTSDICIIDFDQSFPAAGTPSERLGIPSQYLAPEVAVGQPAGPASDVWALGCLIFRARSGEDLFFDHDTDCPADALRQISRVMCELPEQWRRTLFDNDGYAVRSGEEGEPFWSLEERAPLADRVRAIIDEPPSLSINEQGEAVEAAEADCEPELSMLDYLAALRVPYAPAFRTMVWKPTAVCVGGNYMMGYSDEADHALDAFPRISEIEASLLVDLLSVIFVYDAEKRPVAEDLIAHPWFYLSASSAKQHGHGSNPSFPSLVL